MYSKNLNPDNDMIKEVFRELKKEYGYIAKFNSMLSTDKTEDEIINKYGDKAKFVFFTRLESKGKFDGDGNLQLPLFLNWRGNANEIIETFEKYGFPVSWGGTNEDLIRLDTRGKKVDHIDTDTSPHDVELEVNRYLYRLGDNGEKFLIIKSIKGQSIEYTGYKGLDSQLWLMLSNRLGRAENKELNVLIDNRIESVTMEEYIEIYTNLLKEGNDDIDILFEEFSIKALLEVRKNKLSICKTFLTGFKEIENNKEYAVFEKDIKNLSELSGFSHNFVNDDYKLTFIIEER